MARLSTGKRINSATDDSAEVAIASRLTPEVPDTEQAILNVIDDQAMINTAKGARKEIEIFYGESRKLLFKQLMTPTPHLAILVFKWKC